VGLLCHPAANTISRWPSGRAAPHDGRPTGGAPGTLPPVTWSRQMEIDPRCGASSCSSTRRISSKVVFARRTRKKPKMRLFASCPVRPDEAVSPTHHSLLTTPGGTAISMHSQYGTGPVTSKRRRVWVGAGLGLSAVRAGGRRVGGPGPLVRRARERWLAGGLAAVLRGGCLALLGCNRPVWRAMLGAMAASSARRLVELDASTK